MALQPAMNNPAKKTVYCLLALLLFCLIAYWPLTFHLFSLKNDALNYFLPVRHQVSEAIANGKLPFWSAYFNLGYPLHGDMQSGVWNPFVQIFSLFGPYTLRSLQMETLLYVYLTGVGMFFLIKHFFSNLKICLLIATSYMLCGFISDSAQFLNWISGAAFVPFVFLFYYRMVTEKTLKMAACTSIFLWLLFSTAYPADFILCIYVLLFFLLWQIAQKSFGNKNAWLQLLKLHTATALCFVLLCLPAIISYAQFLPLSERGGGANYEQVMSNPLHPALLFSYLTPLPVWKASLAAITDPLERNSFFGLIPFCFLLLGFFTKQKNAFVWFCKWSFIFWLLFSFGQWGGVRIIAYYLLPLMNAFRHPANAKLFTTLFACLLAAFALQGVLRDGVIAKAKKIVIGIVAIFFLLLFLWSFTGSFFQWRNVENTSAKSLLDSLGFSDLLLGNILLQLPFLAVVILFLLKKLKLNVLVAVAIINSIVHTALVQPFTVIKKDSVAAIQQVLDSIRVEGYPLPDLQSTPFSNSVDGMKNFEAIGTTNLYNKKIGRVDYRITPSNLLAQNTFWLADSLRVQVMHSPIFYKALPVTASNKPVPKNVGKKVLVTEDVPTTFLSNDSGFTATVQKFEPGKFVLEINSAAPGFYVLTQNNYPRWQLIVDGKEQKIFTANKTFMGFGLPAGRHTVVFNYQASDLIIAFCISMLTLLLLVWFVRKRKKLAGVAISS